MAAYAALLSLTIILDQIKNHTRHPIFFDPDQDKSLRHNLDFFLQILETYSHLNTRQLIGLKSRIKSAAHKAEDVIESHVVDQIRRGSSSSLNENNKFLQDLQEVIDELESIKDDATNIDVHGMEYRSKQPRPVATSSRPLLTTRRDKRTAATSSRPLLTTSVNKMTAASSSRPHPTTGGKKKKGVEMLGFDDEREQIMEMLTCQHLSRVISIVGMGGSGKTTLAKSIFDDPFVAHHFDVRIWITVTREYTLRSILLQIPICQENATEWVTDYKLCEVLYKSLMGRRYLVVIDDLWSLKAWDEIKQFFPDNDKTSRILLTTRTSNVAAYFGSNSVVRTKYLDPVNSWRLFCRVVFAQEACPYLFVSIGNEIVRKCEGLPLSISVIGGLLATSCMEKKHWEYIAKDISSFLNLDDDEYCLNVLSLSYKYLPIHLKPCFLYMGIIPEGVHIRSDGLIRMWIAEGFLKTDERKSLEEVGEGYLQDLVDRNLILTGQRFVNRATFFCYVHDLLRDLCKRQAQKEGLYCVLNKHDTLYNMYCTRHLVFHTRDINQQDHAGASQVFCGVQPTSVTRSVICPGGGKPTFRSSRLLRILDVSDVDSPEDIFKQINLRFVQCGSSSASIFRLPSSISLLWNLQTLKFSNMSRVSAPSEIWEMQQLRHIEFDEISLPDPPSRVSGHDVLVMGNLQTLSLVINFSCSDEVIERIPNVKQLCIKYDDCSKGHQALPLYALQKLCCLHKLEVLEIYFYEKSRRRIEWIQNLKHLNTLKRLALSCELRWEDLEMIGSLPYLGCLELGNVIGATWSPIEGQFRSLKGLNVQSSKDLIHWNADNSHFPVLQFLNLQLVPSLEEIPLEIGDIATLEEIRLSFCKVSAAISAMKLLEAQESFGNEGLQVWVTLQCSEFKLFQEWRKSDEGQELTVKKFQFRRSCCLHEQKGGRQ